MNVCCHADVRTLRGVLIGWVRKNTGRATRLPVRAAATAGLAGTSDLVGSTVLDDRLFGCPWEAAHESYVGIFIDVGIQPVRMALTHGQYRVVPVNK